MPAPALLLALVVLLARGASAQTTLAAGSALLPTTACPASTVAIGSITYTARRPISPAEPLGARAQPDRARLTCGRRRECCLKA